MIYFILNKELNHLKIGYSLNPKSRLYTLQTANAHKLELLNIYYGTKEDEKTIHSKLKEYNLWGEWYNYAKVKNLIEEIIPNQDDYEISNNYYKFLSENNIPTILPKDVSYSQACLIINKLNKYLSSNIELGIEPYYKNLIDKLYLRNIIISYDEINQEYVFSNINHSKGITRYLKQYFKDINKINNGNSNLSFN